MTDPDTAGPSWHATLWHAPLATLEAALRGLGWHGPGEAPLAPPDPRIGAWLPPPGTAPRVLDGVAYAALATTAPLPLPAGVAETGPDLSAALLGTL